MTSRRDRLRMNAEGDRISSLPDDLIAKILSFSGTKWAVETSVLSSRWEFLWTKLPYLNFSSEDFSTLRKFDKFFTNVLASYNDQVEISLNLHGKVGQVFVRKILNHACSHNLQQLTYKFLDEKPIEFPLSLFSSRSLKHLTLIGIDKLDRIKLISMWELPALTTLHLEYITLYDDNLDECACIFSKCTNLKNLTMKNCSILELFGFTIYHPQLLNLTLEKNWCYSSANVVAPQLKNLTIKGWDGELRITTPNLTSMLYENRTLRLFVDIDNLPSLEIMHLCISNPYSSYPEYRVEDAHKVVDLLQKFNYVKSLTLNLETIEILCSYIEVIMHRPSPFVKLRSLKIYPELYNVPYKTKLTISAEIKNYLLGSSLCATFTMVTREEIRAVRDSKSAQNLWRNSGCC